jgi:hypothetical protein
MEGIGLSKILPPRPEDELLTTSFRLPASLLARLDKIGAESGYNRTEVVIRFLGWAADEHETDQKRSGKK